MRGWSRRDSIRPLWGIAQLWDLLMVAGLLAQLRVALIHGVVVQPPALLSSPPNAEHDDLTQGRGFGLGRPIDPLCL